jgi:cell division septum initiation protein DivIVA
LHYQRMLQGIEDLRSEIKDLKAQVKKWSRSPMVEAACTP